jgi:hypothetical protein
MMPEATSLGTLLEKARPVLRSYLGCDVNLCDPVVIKDWQRNRVMRCRVKSDQADISSVVIKQIKEDSARGFSDWASLAFLSTLPAARGLVPQFYGGDVEEQFFLMEDLGASHSLENVLAGTDPVKAQGVLRMLAVQMARLHAATLAKEYPFQVARQELPGHEGLGRHREAEYWLNNRGKLLDWFHALDCTIPQDWELCLSRIARVYARPGSWLSPTETPHRPITRSHAGKYSSWTSSMVDSAMHFTT